MINEESRRTGLLPVRYLLFCSFYKPRKEAVHSARGAEINSGRSRSEYRSCMLACLFLARSFSFVFRSQSTRLKCDLFSLEIFFSTAVVLHFRNSLTNECHDESLFSRISRLFKNPGTGVEVGSRRTSFSARKSQIDSNLTRYRTAADRARREIREFRGKM